MSTPAHPALNGRRLTGLWRPRRAVFRSRSRAPRVTAADRQLAALLQRRIEPVGVGVELWDGTSPYSASTPAVGHLVTRDRRTLLGLILNPDLWFGEAYTA